jgi:hypothetical protein
MKFRPGLFNDRSAKEMVERHWTAMAERLLQMGGVDAVKPDGDTQIAKVLERGLLHEGKLVRLLGEPNQCHANASQVWIKSDGEALLCTGYALTENQSWLQHSWCVATVDDHGQVILETTDPDWKKYFGFVLDEEESFVFAIANIKPKERLKEVFAESPRMAERLGEILASQMGLPPGGDAVGDSHGVA